MFTTNTSGIRLVHVIVHYTQTLSGYRTLFQNLKLLDSFSLGHTLPAANSMLYDAQRQAAAAYANYGPTAEDQLHQLHYHGKHPVQYNHHPAIVS